MKLTDTQLIVLTEAAKRDDRHVILPHRLQGGAAQKVITPLLKHRLLEEVPVKSGEPIWRRDEEDRPKSLLITRDGLKAIGADDLVGEDKERAAALTQPHSSPRSKSDQANPVKTPKNPKGGNKAKPDRGKRIGGDKTSKVLAALRTKSGATLEALVKLTGWQPHSVRGFLSGVVRKKLALNLLAEAGDKGRTYRIVDTQPAKGNKKRAR